MGLRVNINNEIKVDNSNNICIDIIFAKRRDLIYQKQKEFGLLNIDRFSEKNGK